MCHFWQQGQCRSHGYCHFRTRCCHSCCHFQGWCCHIPGVLLPFSLLALPLSGALLPPVLPLSDPLLPLLLPFSPLVLPLSVMSLPSPLPFLAAKSAPAPWLLPFSDPLLPRLLPFPGIVLSSVRPFTLPPRQHSLDDRRKSVRSLTWILVAVALRIRQWVHGVGGFQASWPQWLPVIHPKSLAQPNRRPARPGPPPAPFGIPTR